MCPFCWMTLILASCMFIGSVVTLVARDWVSWTIGGAGVLAAIAWKALDWFSDEWPLWVIGGLLAIRIAYVVAGRRELLTWYAYREHASSIVKRIRARFSSKQKQGEEDTVV